MIEAGGEGISRRALLTGAGGVAGAGTRHRAATPAGVARADAERASTTRRGSAGVRLVDDEGNRTSAGDIQIGTFYTALPEHGDPEHLGRRPARRQAPAGLPPPARRRAGTGRPQGIVAYSKICPHAGCAISLYRYPTYAPTSAGPAFTCPCHYSTFLPGEGGRLVFGPAGRALPQLPLMIDSQAAICAAAGAFHEDIGPSWWNVHRGES